MIHCLEYYMKHDVDMFKREGGAKEYLEGFKAAIRKDVSQLDSMTENEKILLERFLIFGDLTEDEYEKYEEASKAAISGK